MSNIKEQIKATLQKFGIDPAAHGIKFEDEAAAPVASEIILSAEGVLADGTKIYSTSTDWVVGVDIYTLDGHGNPVAVPAGEYILEDGITTVVVDDMGMVAEINVADPAMAEMSSEDLVAVIGSLSERISALEGEKTALTAEVASVKAELSSVKKAPAAASVKSQEFKKNAVTIPTGNNNTFTDFMETLRAKKSN